MPNREVTPSPNQLIKVESDREFIKLKGPNRNDIDAIPEAQYVFEKVGDDSERINADSVVDEALDDLGGLSMDNVSRRAENSFGMLDSNEASTDARSRYKGSYSVHDFPELSVRPGLSTNVVSSHRTSRGAARDSLGNQTISLTRAGAKSRGSGIDFNCTSCSHISFCKYC